VAVGCAPEAVNKQTAAGACAKQMVALGMPFPEVDPVVGTEDDGRLLIMFGEVVCYLRPPATVVAIRDMGRDQDSGDAMIQSEEEVLAYAKESPALRRLPAGTGPVGAASAAQERFVFAGFFVAFFVAFFVRSRRRVADEVVPCDVAHPLDDRPIRPGRPFQLFRFGADLFLVVGSQVAGKVGSRLTRARCLRRFRRDLQGGAHLLQAYRVERADQGFRGRRRLSRALQPQGARRHERHHQHWSDRSSLHGPQPRARQCAQTA
jgi:hypothetical protein